MKNNGYKATGLANASPLLFICFDYDDNTSKLLIDIWEELFSKIERTK